MAQVSLGLHLWRGKSGAFWSGELAQVKRVVASPRLTAIRPSKVTKTAPKGKYSLSPNLPTWLSGAIFVKLRGCTSLKNSTGVQCAPR